MLRFRVAWVLEGTSLQEMNTDIGYSIYPNNLLLFYLFYLIEKMGTLFSMKEPYVLCIYISCFCVTFSCFLGNLIIQKITSSVRTQELYTIISTIFVLLSPWIIIPYSDTYGMFFVMLGMWALITLKTPYLKWPILAFSSIVGYSIKPTCIFPLFAAFLLYGVYYLTKLRRHWKSLCILLISTILFSLLNALIPIWIQQTFHFKLYKELQMPYTHYLMMGLNIDTRGGYNHGDYLYSSSFPTLAQRKKANWEEIQRRLTNNSKEQLWEFYQEKLLLNFNDGTFAWTQEGGFYAESVGHNNPISEVFQKIYLPADMTEESGLYYYWYRTAAQGIWLFLLFGIVLLFLDYQRFRREKAIIMTVLCGLISFLMLFEARARYLYLYAPIFVILALCGYEGLFKSFHRMYSKET